MRLNIDLIWFNHTIEHLFNLSHFAIMQQHATICVDENYSDILIHLGCDV